MNRKLLEDKVREFATALHAAIDAEIRQELAAALANARTASVARRTGYTYQFESKPCPTCGKENKGRRWRYYCAAHRKDDPKASVQ
jgi:hypothetical protein